MRERFWRIVAALLLATLGILLMAITIIGLPFAIWKLAGWSFVGQEVLFTDKSLRESFRASSDLVRGRWWHALRVVAFLVALLFVAGPVLTLGLIFTPLSFLADQPARGADLLPADPLRGDRPDAALFRPAGTGRGGAGKAPALLATAPVRPGRRRSLPPARDQRVGFPA